MKRYEVHYVERAGFPGACFDSFEAATDKAAKAEHEPYFNHSANTGHCGIRIFRISPLGWDSRKCIFKKFWHA